MIVGLPAGKRLAATRLFPLTAVLLGAPQAADPQSENIDANLVWRLDGTDVGHGREVSLVNLPEGTHSLDLTATAPDGRTALTHQTIEVEADDDGDGLGDGWEEAHGLNPMLPSDTNADNDRDHLAAWEEYGAGSNPDAVDTDEDRYADQIEVAGGSDPADPDSHPVRLPGDDGAAIPRVKAASSRAGTGLLVLLIGALLIAGGAFVRYRPVSLGR